MTSCLTCGGAIFDPGEIAGWGGKICHCVAQPRMQRRADEHSQQSHWPNPSLTNAFGVDAILNELKEIRIILESMK